MQVHYSLHKLNIRDEHCLRKMWITLPDLLLLLKLFHVWFLPRDTNTYENCKFCEYFCHFHEFRRSHLFVFRHLNHMSIGSQTRTFWSSREFHQYIFNAKLERNWNLRFVDISLRFLANLTNSLGFLVISILIIDELLANNIPAKSEPKTQPAIFNFCFTSMCCLSRSQILGHSYVRLR